ncbi:MAG: sirohydrochlorin cobaltochelatase [Niameybacter sp.]
MKKAILVVSFGTSYLEQKKESIDPCIQAIQEAFPDWDVHESFSSSFLRKRLLSEYNLKILSPDETMGQLKQEGYTKVVIQPLFLIEGIEYDKLLALRNQYHEGAQVDRLQEVILASNIRCKEKLEGTSEEKVIEQEVDKAQRTKMKVAVGKALLSTQKDYESVVKEIEATYQGLDTDILLLGHGTTHEAHVSYAYLQEMLDATILNCMVTTLEDRCNLHQMPFKNDTVTIVPFMLVAGMHILKDVMGDQEASFKSGLEALDKQVKVVQKGLGSYLSTRQVYITHIQKVINKL